MVSLREPRKKKTKGSSSLLDGMKEFSTSVLDQFYRSHCQLMIYKCTDLQPSLIVDDIAVAKTRLSSTEE